jgi:hypothetical protein
VRILLFALLACAISAFPALGDNIVVNGDFETGDLTGWSVNAGANDPWQVLDADPIAGSYSAATGCAGTECVDVGDPSAAASLSQNLATTPGGVYTLTFLENNGGEPEDLVVLWGGSVVLDLCPGSTGCGPGSGNLFTVAGLAATSDSTELTFLGRDDPGYIRLDNIDVEPAGAPEPATSVTVALCALASVIRACRGRKSNDHR